MGQLSIKFKTNMIKLDRVDSKKILRLVHIE